MPSDLTLPHGAVDNLAETDFLEKKEGFLDLARERNTSDTVIFRPKQAIPRSAAILKSAAAILKSAALRKKVRHSSKDKLRTSPFKVGTTNKVWRCRKSKTSRDHLEKKALEETDQGHSLRRSAPVLRTCSSLGSSRVQSQTFESRPASIRVSGRAEIYIRYVKPEQNSYSTCEKRQVRSFIRSPVGSSGERRYKWGAS